MPDVIAYLNQSLSSPMFGRLQAALEQSKQGRAAPAQWTAMIRALTQKGVKQLEIDDSGILDWLACQGTQPIEKKTLLSKLNSMMFTVKEVDLGSPKYPTYRQPGGQYHEYLYIANSERDNVVDELEQVEDQMQSLVFEPERLVDEPELVVRLEAERMRLLELKNKALDFEAHHYSNVVNGRLGRNLLAHARVTEREDIGLYFIDEFQSDWAQRGRKNEWRDYPRGPLVTNTEAWAGLLVRRQFQIAASNPAMRHIAWITESMSNGGTQNLDREERDAAMKRAFDERVAALAAQSMETWNLPPDATAEQKSHALSLARSGAEVEARREGLSRPHSSHNEFYLKVIPRLVDKLLAGTGVKVEFMDFSIGGRPCKVPAIALTDAARQRLADRQPLYSRASLLTRPRDAHDERVILEIAQLTRRAGMLLGSTRHVRFVTHAYDVATGRKVAGRYFNRLIQVSLGARDLRETLDHECFHFAQENLLTDRENRLVLDAFAPGAPLNAAVRETLTRRGDFALARQCIDPNEAAAQGFALWANGELDASDTPAVSGFFQEIVEGARAVVRWFRREILDHQLQTVEDVYGALRGGWLADREAESARHACRAHRPQA